MITELTQEQRDKMEEYRKRGIALGINTDPVDDETIIQGVKAVYEHILKKEIPEGGIVIKDSPKSGWKFICEHVGEEMDYVHPYLDGHLFSYFFSYYDYMAEVLGVQYDCITAYEALRNILNFGNLYPLDDICVVTRKPVEVHMNAQDQYHCETGMAVRYADGYGIYMLNGVSVPGWLVETPWEKLDPLEFAKIQNVEVRREFVRKLGVERLIQKLGAKVIDKKGDYELVLVDLGGDTGEWPYLKMKNPSIGIWHVEAVDENCRTVDDAIRFRNGGSTLEPTQLT